MEDEILAFLGRIIAYGGGSAAVAFLVFRFLGEKWIEDKFASRLERLRHEHARELERLRAEVDAMLSGAVRLQEKEFEVLPEAWSQLHSAKGQITSVVSPMQQYADVARMNDAQLDELLEDSIFTQTQRDSIRAAAERSKVYQDLCTRHEMIEAIKKFAEFKQYVDRHSIFLPPDLREKFERAADILWSATVAKRIGHEHDDFKMQHGAWTKLDEEFNPLYGEIKQAIQDRLQEHGRPAAESRS